MDIDTFLRNGNQPPIPGRSDREQLNPIESARYYDLFTYLQQLFAGFSSGNVPPDIQGVPPQAATHEMLTHFYDVIDISDRNSLVRLRMFVQPVEQQLVDMERGETQRNQYELIFAAPFGGVTAQNAGHLHRLNSAYIARASFSHDEQQPPTKRSLDELEEFVTLTESVIDASNGHTAGWALA